MAGSPQAEQIALIDEGWERGDSVGELTPSPKPTAEDMRILLWLNTLGRPATHFQIGWRWGRFAGRDPASCYRALRRLTHGLSGAMLDEHALQEAKGNASQRAVWFSREGADFLGVKKLKRLAAWRPRVLLEAIARTDFELETESTGWVKVPEQSTYAALIRQQLNHMRHRTLTPTEAHIRDLLERALRRGGCPTMPLAAIQHEASGEVRLVAHARHGFSVAERLQKMPDIGLLGAIEICVLGGDTNKVYAATDAIRYWAQRGRHTVTATRVPSWRKRANPNRSVDMATQRYGLNGISEFDDPCWFAHPHQGEPVNI